MGHNGTVGSCDPLVSSPLGNRIYGRCGRANLGCSSGKPLTDLLQNEQMGVMIQ